MLRAKKVDITGGPIIKSMLLFSLPIILGALVQVAFNAADLIVVGKMGGTESSAAVGAVSPVVNLLVNSFIGLSVGINAVLSRILGQNDIKRAGRVVNTAVISSVVLGIILMVVCFAFSKPLLQSLNCDKEYIDGAILYMNIFYHIIKEVWTPLLYRILVLFHRISKMCMTNIGILSNSVRE